MSGAERGHTTAGVLLGTGGQLIWGLFPAYWKLLAGVPALEVLLHRVVWSFVLLLAAVLVTQRWSRLIAVARSRRQVGVLGMTTLLIASNWLIFIWAANSGRVLEISLGFFINPLINVVLGMALLGERLPPRQIAGVILAAAGVLNLVAAGGAIPWTALALAVTFAFYGLLRKANPVDPVVGLTVETGLLTPIAALYLGVLLAGGEGAMGHAPAATIAFLLLAGAVTAAPLLLYVAAVHRLRYATIGLLQYLSPSMHFLLAVSFYGEQLTAARAVTFACIWGGIALFVSRPFRPAQSEA